MESTSENVWFDCVFKYDTYGVYQKTAQRHWLTTDFGFHFSDTPSKMARNTYRQLDNGKAFLLLTTMKIQTYNDTIIIFLINHHGGPL